MTSFITFPFNSISQGFPPKPAFTEKDISDLSGKVYIVTGANTGVGKQVARILYSKNARVYVAARSEEKATKAIEDIRQAVPDSSGELIFLLLDLADLSTIRASAQRFLDRESQLHVLFNNAGVMQAATSDVTPQGYELQLGVNNIGPFLFTKLLTPTLAVTAKTSPPGSVRVVWVGSLATESPLVPTGGVDMSDIDNRSKKNAFYNYVVSKAGNYLHAVEYARRHESDGIVSIPLNPGNLSSDLWRWQQSWFRAIFSSLMLHPPVYGAYTELFAGLSPSITMANTGQWVIPWGRFASIRRDLLESTKSGSAAAFWQWTEDQVKPYL